MPNQIYVHAAESKEHSRTYKAYTSQYHGLRDKKKLLAPADKIDAVPYHSFAEGSIDKLAIILADAMAGDIIANLNPRLDKHQIDHYILQLYQNFNTTLRILLPEVEKIKNEIPAGLTDMTNNSGDNNETMEEGEFAKLKNRIRLEYLNAMSAYVHDLQIKLAQ